MDVAVRAGAMKHLAAVLVVAAGICWAQPVGAVAPGIQGLVVTAVPGFYPCTAPFCSGPLTGVGTAQVAGLSTTSQPFVAHWPDPTQPLPSTNLAAGAQVYSIVDTCLVSGPTPSLTGSGAASFSLSGGLLEYQGQALHGATLSINLSWDRDGNGLAIFLASATVVAPNGTTIATEASLAAGVGTGTWTVLSGVGTCGAPLTNPSVQIAASFGSPE